LNTSSNITDTTSPEPPVESTPPPPPNPLSNPLRRIHRRRPSFFLSSWGTHQMSRRTN
jgi:hypothetical protein